MTKLLVNEKVGINRLVLQRHYRNVPQMTQYGQRSLHSIPVLNKGNKMMLSHRYNYQAVDSVCERPTGTDQRADFAYLKGSNLREFCRREYRTIVCVLCQRLYQGQYTAELNLGRGVIM